MPYREQSWQVPGDYPVGGNGIGSVSSPMYKPSIPMACGTFDPNTVWDQIQKFPLAPNGAVVSSFTTALSNAGIPNPPLAAEFVQKLKNKGVSTKGIELIQDRIALWNKYPLITELVALQKLKKLLCGSISGFGEGPALFNTATGSVIGDAVVGAGIGYLTAKKDSMLWAGVGAIAGLVAGTAGLIGIAAYGIYDRVK